MLTDCLAAGGGAPITYLPNNELGKQLQELARANPKLLHLKSAAKSMMSNDVWLVELGSGGVDQRGQRPAMLVVAGVEGNDLAGSASALAWVRFLAENYSQEPQIRQLLETTTVYVFPTVNPDAAEPFFATPRFERATSLRPVDDDKDGIADEDGPEDLNGDGLITWMRVEDPDGEYMPDPGEPRLLVKADRTRNEMGVWRLLVEGVDNDKDEAWNEDGPGGVNFNRNFPYGYRFFAPWAGTHQVSEVETRLLADFVVAHPNIGIVFTFGAADNLAQTPKTEAPKRPPVTIHEEDIAFYREFGKTWREMVGLRKEGGGTTEPGTFSDWVYFHRGRLSLAARAWSPALAVDWGPPAKGADQRPGDAEPGRVGEAKDGAAKTDKDGAGKKAEGDTRNEEERALLKWVDANAPGAFLEWKAVEHVDFPGKRVEIGGFAPFARTNPPEKLLAELTEKHSKFLTALAGKLPRIKIRKSEAKHLGESIYEVTLQVENVGYLPTALAQGNLSREVYPTRVVLATEPETILAGSRRTMLGPIEGNGGARKVHYVLNAGKRKTVDVDVISMLGGTVKTTIELKEEK